MADVNYKISLEGIRFHVVSVGRGNTGHVKMHSHSIASYEIHYIESGQGILRLRSDEYMLEQGTFFLTGPGIAHEQITMSEEPMEEIVMYYTVPLVCGDGENRKREKKREPWLEHLLSQRFWIGEGPREVWEPFRRIVSEVQDKPPGYRTLVPLLAGELFISLGRLYQTGGTETGETYVPCSEEAKYLQIERIFLDDPVHITIGKLAGELGLSVRQVQRLMKSHYGITFRQMQMENKLELVCRLLEEKEYSLEDIAERTGFSSADYMGYCFRQKYGISPGKYRRK